MDKYGVEVEQRKTCPKCGRDLNESGLCSRCGSEPLERSPRESGLPERPQRIPGEGQQRR